MLALVVGGCVFFVLFILHQKKKQEKKQKSRLSLWLQQARDGWVYCRQVYCYNKYQCVVFAGASKSVKSVVGSLFDCCRCPGRTHKLVLFGCILNVFFEQS